MSRELVADPYPHFAAERAEHAVAWHEPTRRWLTFTHATADAVLRHRALQRIWKDRAPEDYLEPFNLLHRNQMMENEPPVHTRLRRAVSTAFNKGHVERLRPRVRELAGELLDAIDPEEFDVVGAYAEPLPVLVIADLLGVPTSYAGELRAWSQAIVRMYEAEPPAAVVDAAVLAATEFAAFVRELIARRRACPGDDLTTDLLSSGLSGDEILASVVLLLNAGHEASVNVFGNGLVATLQAGARPTEDVPLAVEEMLRFDAALQLFERTAVEPVELGGVTVEPGQRVAALLGAANRDPAVFERADELDLTRDPNPHLAFGAGIHFCLGSPLARMELAESVGALFNRFPTLELVATEPRGTFVLRGHRSVTVRGSS